MRVKSYSGSTAMFANKASGHQKKNLALRNQPTFASIVAATTFIVKQPFAMNALEKNNQKQSMRITKKPSAFGKQDQALKIKLEKKNFQ